MDAGNGFSRGIWSDGMDMFVVDTTSGAQKVFSYSMSDMAYGSARSFDLEEGNDHPAGIWSDGATLWVVDTGDDKLYAYGLPAAEAVSDDATLGALSLSGITLSPSFAADTLAYTASVDNDVASTTVTATANDDGATVAIVPADADDTADGHQVTLAVGDTAVSVTVTAEDGTTMQTYAVTVTRAEVQEAATTVPAAWGLIPSGLGAGDSFRLIFTTSGKRNATATDIADYNSFVQTAAAAGHADIQQYNSGFRVVGSTADVDARDNTATTYTSADKGVAIYWLGGNKVADEYEDFYDETWDDEANAKDESGSDRSTSLGTDKPLTGSDHNGTEAFSGASSRALGASSVQLGSPNSSTSGNGPLSSNASTGNSSTRPLYGLSPVFRVSDQAIANNPPAFSSAASFSTDENQAATFQVTAEDADDGDEVSYAITSDGADTAYFQINATTGLLAFLLTLDHENPADAGRDNVYRVTVTATGGTGGPCADDRPGHHRDRARRGRAALRPGSPHGLGRLRQQRQPVGGVDRPRQQRQAGHRVLRPAIPQGHHRRLYGRPAGPDGGQRHHRRAGRGLGLPGAGAGHQRRGRQRLVDRGQRDHERADPADGCRIHCFARPRHLRHR